MLRERISRMQQRSEVRLGGAVGVEVSKVSVPSSYFRKLAATPSLVPSELIGISHEARTNLARQVGRDLGAQRRDVAVAGRVVPVEAGVDPVLAGEDRAAVVGVEVSAGEARAGRDLDGEIGLADLVARGQAAADADAAQVAET